MVKIQYKSGDGFLLEVKMKEKRSSLKMRIGMLAEQAEKTKSIAFNTCHATGIRGKSLFKD
ncbi:MAG TPA: hypothetical protein VK177_15575 [Flavobacteriales bacterium]|nr:hypothetical protein [Flavobacteriales bacterium]